MKRLLFALLLTLLCISTIPLVSGRKKVTDPKRVPQNAILLSKVESLTLRSGKPTSSRRVSPVPQLQCVGPKDVCRLYTVDVMRCRNEGSDYNAEDIQWSCKASLPDEFKLGSTEVVCEGYESSADPYVLKGSCGVEYKLLLTDKGEAKYGRGRARNKMGSGGAWGWGAREHLDNSDYWTHRASDRKGGNKLATLLFFVLFFSVLFVIVKRFIQSWRRQSREPRRLGPPRGGGGGGGGDDPPPPYDSHDFGSSNTPRRPRKQQPPPSSSSSSGRTGGSSANQQAQDAWRPGFWTGALGGAAAGYFAGQRRSYQEQRRQEAMQRTTGGMFGGPWGSRSPDSGWGAGPSSSSTSGPSHSSRSHESTGFGGTRRR